MKPVDFATSMQQIALYLQDIICKMFAQYTRPKDHDLSRNNKRGQWSCILLWQYYLSLFEIRIIFFSKYDAQNLVWNRYGRLSSNPFLKSSIPSLWFHSILASSIFYTEISVYSISCPAHSLWGPRPRMWYIWVTIVSLPRLHNKI